MPSLSTGPWQRSAGSRRRIRISTSNHPGDPQRNPISPGTRNPRIHGMPATSSPPSLLADLEETIGPGIQAEAPVREPWPKRSIRLLLWFGIYAFPAFIVMRTYFDPDIWSHLRTG